MPGEQLDPALADVMVECRFSDEPRMRLGDLVLQSSDVVPPKGQAFIRERIAKTEGLLEKGFDLDEALDTTLGDALVRDDDNEIVRQSYEDALLAKQEQPQEAAEKK